MAALAAAGASGGGVGALFGVWDVVQAALCLATAALVRRVDEAEIARAKRAAVEAQREADAATSRLKQLDGASTARPALLAHAGAANAAAVAGAAALAGASARLAQRRAVVVVADAATAVRRRVAHTLAVPVAAAERGVTGGGTG